MSVASPPSKFCDAEHPDVLEILSQPLHVDRRGGTREGEAPTVDAADRLLGTATSSILRYLRYWIEAGHEKVRQPLTADQRRALDALDDVLKRPALRVELRAGAGPDVFHQQPLDFAQPHGV